ncbi:MAG: tetratricopeptide repeat protein [Chloroflexota bacterium]
MYVNPDPPRRTPLLSIFRVATLLILVTVSLWFLQQVIAGESWARPFDPTPTPTLPAIAYINQGDIAFAEGHLTKAIMAYETAIDLDADNDVAYQRQAKLLVYTGNTAQALLRAEKAVLLNPNSPENLTGYCQALDWEGYYGAASDACECAIELDSEHAPAYAYLAEVYADQALWRSARTTAQQAIDIDFQSPEAHHNMGYALEVQRRYREAIEFYENAITLRPNLAPFYMSAGQIYYTLGQFETAADRFGQAIKLNPTDPKAYDQIGWTYFANGEYNRAIDALQQAISVEANHSRAWGRLATIHYLRQNYEEAIKTYLIAVELSEKQFLRKAREINIMHEIQGSNGPELVAVLRGRFEQVAPDQKDQLVASVVPIQWSNRATSGFIADSEDAVTTCGHIIARKIQNQIVQTSPARDIQFSRAFSKTTGIATLNLTTGELSLNLENIPRPLTLPYEVQIRYRPNTITTIGYAQPVFAETIEQTFSLVQDASGPLEYYFGLGLSYAYIDPPQCEAAIPWLITAVKKEPAFHNPAWEGFKICPSIDAPPTPLPTATPIPDADES